MCHSNSIKCRYIQINFLAPFKLKHHLSQEEQMYHIRPVDNILTQLEL